MYNNFLEFNLLILAFCVVYFLIKSKLSFKLRRRALLATPILALFTIELNSLIMSLKSNLTDIVIVLDVFSFQAEVVSETSVFFSWSWFYGTGLVISLLILLYKIGSVLFFFRNLEYKRINGIKLYSSEKAGSFTFFNKIHLAESDIKNLIILEHESIHVAKRHTSESMLMEIYQLILWFNPLIYWMKYELKRVQEFEVDEILYKKHQNTYIETLLNYSFPYSTYANILTSQFYTKLSLAKRTKIMKNSIQKNLKLIIVLPFLAVVFSFISCNPENPIVEEIMVAPEIEEVIVEPKFAIDDGSYFKFLGENITYPETSKQNDVEGKVYAGIEISEMGKVQNIHIKRGINTEIDAEVIRVLQLMPNWIPGTKNGEKVKMEMVIPINFALK